MTDFNLGELILTGFFGSLTNEFRSNFRRIFVNVLYFLGWWGYSGSFFVRRECIGGIVPLSEGFPNSLAIVGMLFPIS